MHVLHMMHVCDSCMHGLNACRCLHQWPGITSAPALSAAHAAYTSHCLSLSLATSARPAAMPLGRASPHAHGHHPCRQCHPHQGGRHCQVGSCHVSIISGLAGLRQGVVVVVVWWQGGFMAQGQSGPVLRRLAAAKGRSHLSHKRRSRQV